uniref:Hcr9-OR3A n=1 Tax=Solanum tuberosum TaxID=4113 RepID=M1D3D1_SOLTU
MDLSSNGFSGKLPASLFDSFYAMKIINENITTSYLGVQYDTLTITTKGLDLQFFKVFDQANIVIDLSNNRFEGYIPRTIGDLIGLRTLNLSHNNLKGHIPTSLHQLSVVESLDVSFNKISGEIPQQLASLTFLAVLNLSHKHLVGCIPKGKQFDTFENNSYKENDGLCGFPLSKECGGDDGVPHAATQFGLDQEEEGDSSIVNWQAVLMGHGCGLVIVLSVIYMHIVGNRISIMVFEVV